MRVLSNQLMALVALFMATAATITLAGGGIRTKTLIAVLAMVAVSAVSVKRLSQKSERDWYGSLAWSAYAMLSGMLVAMTAALFALTPDMSVRPMTAVSSLICVPLAAFMSLMVWLLGTVEFGREWRSPRFWVVLTIAGSAASPILLLPIGLATAVSLGGIVMIFMVSRAKSEPAETVRARWRQEDAVAALAQLDQKITWAEASIQSLRAEAEEELRQLEQMKLRRAEFAAAHQL